MGAMDFFSDPQATSARFGDVIDDLHDVFRCHGVDFGSPDDFFAFARTVKYHSELHSDVMRVVKFVMDSETNVSFRTILTILAVASGGLEVATSAQEMRVPVSLVIESLVGAGDCSPLNGEQQRESPAPEPTANEAVETVTLERAASGSEELAAGAEVERKRMLLEEPVIDTWSDTSTNSMIDPSPLLGRNDSNALAESLSRIEMNSLQLKIYLDSIEQRLSRMEPRLENVPPAAISGPQAPARDTVGMRFSAVVAPPSISSSSSSETGTELLHTEPSGVESRELGRVTTGSPASLRHLWRDSRRSFVTKRQKALPILGGLAMLLLSISFAWRLGRDTGYVVIRPVNALAQQTSDAGGFSPARAAASSAGDSLAGTAGKPKATVARNTSVSPVGEAQRDNPIPVDSGASQGPRRSADTRVPSPEKRVALRSLLSSSPAGETKAAAAMTDTSEDPAPTDRTSKLGSEPLSDRPVNVSSGVMEANLISGPKPSYPALAGLTHTQGDVVMLAAISKDGIVKDLHVIKGHRLLRGAAKSAVRSWRYRPYTIDGVPVEVATIVSVDFSLQR